MRQINKVEKLNAIAIMLSRDALPYDSSNVKQIHTYEDATNALHLLQNNFVKEQEY